MGGGGGLLTSPLQAELEDLFSDLGLLRCPCSCPYLFVVRQAELVGLFSDLGGEGRGDGTAAGGEGEAAALASSVIRVRRRRHRITRLGH